MPPAATPPHDSSGTDCDVLIVGGGPAGLSVAAALPDHVATIVVHQDAEIGKPIRSSGGSWLEDVRALGIPPHLYTIIERSEAYSDNMHITLPFHTNKPVILSITALYRWLGAQSEHKHRQLMLATKFIGAERLDDGRHAARLRGRDGATRVIRARFLVDASGWHCAVVSALGLVARPERLGVGAEYVFALGNNRSDRAILFTGTAAKNGYGWGYPTPEGTFRLGIGVLRPDTDANPRVLLDELMQSDPEARFDIQLGADHEVHGGILPSVPYDPKLVFGNVIRVGDAANVATPTLGEGIRLSIENGRDLGQALGRVLASGRRGPLRAYQWRCRWKFQKNYYFGYLINRRATRYGPADWDASIARMGRVDETLLRQTMRSEFALRKISAMVFSALRARLLNRLHRARARR